jgi:hypothetical protein
MTVDFMFIDLMTITIVLITNGNITHKIKKVSNFYRANIYNC